MTNNKNMLEKFIKKGLVIKRGTWYKLLQGDQEINLGNSKKTALIKLKEHPLTASDQDSIDPSLDNNGDSGNENVQSDQANSQKPSPDKEPNNRPTKESKENNIEEDVNEELYANLLGQIDGIEPNHESDFLKVYIHGVDSTLKDNPKVKACPFVFRWRDKARNVPSDHDLTVNRGYVRVSKKMVKKPNGTSWLKVDQDDTPLEDHFTAGSLELFYTDKAKFEIRKKREAIKTLLGPQKSKEARNEFAKRQTKHENIEKASQAFANANANDSGLMQETMKNQGMSASEIESKLGAMDDPEKALELAQRHSAGEDITDQL